MLESRIDTTPTIKPLVLNISGWRTSRSRKKQNQNATEEPSVPKFNSKEFPSIVGGILLRTDSPANANSPNWINKYLCVLCLNNTRTNVRMYHMYYSIEDHIYNDWDRVELLYKNMRHIKYSSHLTIKTFCPESLHRSAVKHFTMYKWNNHGNVLETPMSETVEQMTKTLEELSREKEQFQKFLNYIRFIKMSKC